MPLRRLFCWSVATVALGGALVPAYAAEVKRPLINDVGRGAFLWGTSDEVTTYSEPYLPYKTPEIYRIPETASTQVSTSTNDQISAAAKKLGDPNAVGTIFGTDGKLYEYYYVKGVEPRRVVRVERVKERPSNGLAPIWVDKTVEKIEWEPVWIRVLRPLGASAKDREALAQTPQPMPCEPLGNAQESAQNQSINPGVQPDQTVEVGQPSANPPRQPGDNSNVVAGQTQVDGSITLNLDRSADAAKSPASRPTIVLPEALRQNSGARR
ncbi:MAG: hypothetical protein Q4G03_01525 [Planctomycetia bacterium]|nr:hypothetical protein [Planctomycetia bacterium]